MFDVEAPKRFYLDYLGCELDWEEGGGGLLSRSFSARSRTSLN